MQILWKGEKSSWSDDEGSQIRFEFWCVCVLVKARVLIDM